MTRKCCDLVNGVPIHRMRIPARKTGKTLGAHCIRSLSSWPGVFRPPAHGRRSAGFAPFNAARLPIRLASHHAAWLAGVAILLTAAWLRGAEYDEQYTLFLTAGTARPAWPTTPFPAALVQATQTGHSDFLQILTDLRRTDVHPPLYFWAASLWRTLFGSTLFTARLLSVAFGAISLALVARIARQINAPRSIAIVTTALCYGFAYTNAVARGFAPAETALLTGMSLLLQKQPGKAGLAFGMAAACNYLSVFPAIAAGLVSKSWRAIPGTIPFLLLDAWCFAAQHASRAGQFPPFHWLPALERLTGYEVAAVFGALPLYWQGPGHWIAFGMVALGSLALLTGIILAGDKAWVARTSPVGAKLRTITSWPGVSGPSRANETRERFQYLARGASLARDSPHEAGYDSGEAGFDRGEAGFDRGEAGFDRGEAVFDIGEAVFDRCEAGFDSCEAGFDSGEAGFDRGIALLAPMGTSPAITVSHGRDSPSQSRSVLAAAAIAPAIGLLILGIVFNNAPIEFRYLSFGLPFLALLTANTGLASAITLLVQSAGIAGLLLAPQTMQPARAAARFAAPYAGHALALLPSGNDGVGIVGAFGIEAPPGLMLSLVHPDQPIVIPAGTSRVILILLGQDTESRAVLPQMEAAVKTCRWHLTATGPNVKIYDRVKQNNSTTEPAKENAIQCAM